MQSLSLWVPPIFVNHCFNEKLSSFVRWPHQWSRCNIPAQITLVCSAFTKTETFETLALGIHEAYRSCWSWKELAVRHVQAMHGRQPPQVQQHSCLWPKVTSVCDVMQSSARKLSKIGHASIMATLLPEKKTETLCFSAYSGSLLGSSPELHTAVSPCVNIAT